MPLVKLVAFTCAFASAHALITFSCSDSHFFHHKTQTATLLPSPASTDITTDNQFVIASNRLAYVELKSHTIPTSPRCYPQVLLLESPIVDSTWNEPALLPLFPITMPKISKMTLAELKELAAERGVDATAFKVRQHFIDSLTATHTKTPVAAAKIPKGIPKASASGAKKPTGVPELSKANVSGYGLEAAIDYGTWKMVVTCAFTGNGERIEDPITLTFDDDNPEVRMMAAFVGDEFLHGAELERRADLDPSISDKVMSSFKLAIYPNSQTSRITKRITKILEECGKTLDDLLVEHMRAIWNDIKTTLKTTTMQVQFTEAEFDELFERAHVRVTVPQMWGPNARRRMQAAAKKAGMSVVVLSSEPHCALAYLIYKEGRKRITPERQLRRLDSVLVADLGCGTADFAMLELTEDLGASSNFRSIGQSSGDLCGSGMVDEHLYEALTMREGRAWFVKSSQHLGVTERDFQRRVSTALERIKRKFDPAKANELALVKGIGIASLPITITKAEYESAMNTVIDKIKKQIDSFVKKRTPTVIEVTGGFARSRYLMDTLRTSYGPLGIIVMRPSEGITGHCFPVAMGALIRYDTIRPQKLPARYGYALSIREHFDPALHPDACTIEWDADAKEDIVTYKPCVLSAFHDAEVDLVEHRIRNIITKGSVIEEGQTVTHELQLQYWIPWEDPRISADFVVTRKHFEDHAAAKDYNPATETYKFCSGVGEWASVEIPIPRNQLQAKGFPTEVAHNEHFWVVWARVVVLCRNEDFQIGFEVLKPPTEDAEGHTDEVAFKVTDTVWQAEHSEFLE